jgi:hypothetical protein
VITSLLEIAGSENKTRWPPPAGATLDRTSFAATRRVCLEGALARPCTFSVGARDRENARKQDSRYLRVESHASVSGSGGRTRR